MMFLWFKYWAVKFVCIRGMAAATWHHFKMQRRLYLHILMQVQLDIRTGHQQTVDKVLNWFDEEGGVKGTSICDAGCGTGSLSLPLALRVRDLLTSHSLLMHCCCHSMRHSCCIICSFDCLLKQHWH